MENINVLEIILPSLLATRKLLVEEICSMDYNNTQQMDKKSTIEMQISNIDMSIQNLINQLNAPS